jgi:hypothetical protein
MPPIDIAHLNRLDIEGLRITDEEILSAIETSLAAQGSGDTVIEPRVQLEPGAANGYFNVLRGAIKPPIDHVGVNCNRRDVLAFVARSRCRAQGTSSIDVARSRGPLHTGHLRTMPTLSELGAIIYPPVPALYTKPADTEEMIDQTVARVLDLYDIDLGIVSRWKDT